jgi:hypothetical protein
MTDATASTDLVHSQIDTEESRRGMNDFSDQEPLTDEVWSDFVNWLKTAPTPGADAQSQSVTALKNPVSWLSSALADVARVAALPPSWDGHGSPQLGTQEREYATDLLASIDYEDVPAPTIVPVSGGGMQLEWQHKGRELELEIVAGSQELLFLKVYTDETAEEGGYPIVDWGKTQELLHWLLVG